MVRQLRAAHASLGAWEDSLRAAGPGARPPGPNTRELLALLSETRRGLQLRLNELEGALSHLAPPALAVRPIAASPAPPPENLCLAACRACGRALGAAFREAQSAADAASARGLYGSLRAMEKLLWVLDPLQAR